MTNMINTTDVTSGARSAYPSWTPAFCPSCPIFIFLCSVLWTIACIVLFSLDMVLSPLLQLTASDFWIMFICTIISLYIKSKLCLLLEVSLYLRGRSWSRSYDPCACVFFLHELIRAGFLGLLIRVELLSYHCLVVLRLWSEVTDYNHSAYQIANKINILLNL